MCGSRTRWPKTRRLRRTCSVDMQQPSSKQSSTSGSYLTSFLKVFQNRAFANRIIRMRPFLRDPRNEFRKDEKLCCAILGNRRHRSCHAGVKSLSGFGDGGQGIVTGERSRGHRKTEISEDRESDVATRKAGGGYSGVLSLKASAVFRQVQTKPTSAVPNPVITQASRSALTKRPSK